MVWSKAMEELFQEIRKNCSTAVWSRGVELARVNAVSADSESDGAIHLRVRAAATGLSPEVTLYVEDLAWDCSCGGDEDPCAHVAAAAIAVRRAAEQGVGLPKSKVVGGKVIYAFQRRGKDLALVRSVRQDDGTELPLATSLSGITSGRVKGPLVAATGDDMEIEQALESPLGGVLPNKSWAQVIKAFSRTSTPVTLDDKQLRCVNDPVGLQIVISDEGPGVRVFAEQDPDIIEVFNNGVALCRSGLRAIAQPRLLPREEGIIRKGQFFGQRELSSLASDVLPSLEEKFPLIIRTKKLPDSYRSRPRIELTLECITEGLQVTPAIVYGDPVVARVIDGRMESFGGSVPMRDHGEELRILDEMSRELRIGGKGPTTLLPADAMIFEERLGRFRGDVVGNGAGFYKRYAALTPELKVLPSGQWSLDFSLGHGGTRKADGSAVLRAWQKGESIVPLIAGGFAELPKDWLERYGDKISALLSAREASSDEAKTPAAAIPLLTELCTDLGVELSANLADWKKKWGDFSSIPEVPVPKDLAANLRDYQVAGFHWLSFLRGMGMGGLLADDMGLGKTLQTIAAVKGRTLVVAPTSVLYNWKHEIEKFRPSLGVSVYHGPDRALGTVSDVVLTSYAVLRLDQEMLSAVHWDMIVLDEAQAIKNPDAQVSRAAFALNGDFRVCLTGTPVENRLDDIYSQLHFACPGLLGTKKFFTEHYARPISQGVPGSAERFRARIKPFVLRRMKSEVARELPPRTDSLMYVELSSAERSYYDSLLATTRRDVVERLNAGGSIMEALEALLRLRQACCHPDLLPGVSNESSSKIEALLEDLTVCISEGHKALVFSQWTSYLDLIEESFKKAGLAYVRLDGSTVDRAGVVAKFQDPNGPEILLMSLKAGGVGLNLTAADHVFMMDPWWNPAAEDQAADRAHRIGQDRPVFVKKLVAVGTLEERIIALQDSKRLLASAVVGDGGQALTITREDLIALFD